jgi:transaldolase
MMSLVEDFSLWCDFVERDFLSKDFSQMIKNGYINGATSNPAIFKEAILKSPAYRQDIKKLRSKNLSPKEIYEELATADIKEAAKRLLPLYERGDDGFISIEVDPSLCNDANETVKEAMRLYKKIDMPNVMIKIPATKEGYMAMERLFSEGININATLIFSPAQTKECLEAFKKGLEKLSSDVAPKAVISIFVSRFDRELNDRLRDLGMELNLVGIFNATKLYKMIEDENIKEVRALFASTGVKGGDLEEDYYIKTLLYKNSVNTAPLKTIEAFLNSNIRSCTTPIDSSKIDDLFSKLKDKNVDINEIYKKLLDEGLEAFKVAFKEILEELEKG